MRASFTSDPHKGAGFGIITVQQLSCNNAPTFALYRASDGLCLSANDGWQNSEAYLTPTAWDNDANNLRLSVDASIVDHLDALDTYKLLIKDGANSPISNSLSIESINYSSLHGGQGVGSAPRVTPASMPEPEPALEPAPIPEPIMEEPLPEMPPEQKRNFWPIIIAILILLILLGAGLWWYLQNNANEGITPKTTEEQKQNLEQEALEDTKQEQQKVDENPTEESSANEKSKDEAKAKQTTTTPVLSPMQQAREFLRGDNNSTGTASHALANNLLSNLGAAPDEESLDAIFLLLEDAAQKNEPKAMLELAKYYDPSGNKPKGSILPDANEAYNWYKKALDAGETQASKHLEQLNTWLKEAADKGDKSAQNLLNNITQN